MTKAKAKSFEIIWLRAQLAGIEAGRACNPVGMRVVQRANPFDDASPEVQHWDVPDGPCGFAYVVVKPATSSFARWLKTRETQRTYGHHGGGLCYSVWEYNQSIQRKAAHAEAMAKVLNENGITCYAYDRMD